jgi:hypothetical protein
VCITFELDHDAFRQTTKVHDESVQDVLPAEFETEYATIAQQGPRMPLGRRASLSELTRERVQLTAA